MMVLDSDFRCRIAAVKGVFRGEVFRMKVVRDDRGLYVEESLKMADAFFIRRKCFKVIQIADVVAYEGIFAAEKTEGIFKFGAAGENGIMVRGAWCVVRSAWCVVRGAK